MDTVEDDTKDDEPLASIENLLVAIRDLCAAYDRDVWTPSYDLALATLVPGALALAISRRHPPHNAFEEGCIVYQEDARNPGIEAPLEFSSHNGTSGMLDFLRSAVLRYCSYSGQDLCWEHIETLRRCLPECRALLLKKHDVPTCLQLCKRFREKVEDGMAEEDYVV